MSSRVVSFLRKTAIGFCAVLFYCYPAFAASPVNGSISPSSGSSNSGQEATFTTTFTDADGWQNLQLGYLLFSTSSTSRTNCFYAYYNQNTDKLYLRNDANSAWLGGFAPGSANVIENSYAKLNCAASSVSGSGAAMSVTWKITFKQAFSGAKNAYLSVKDDSGASQGLTQKGAWTVNAANVPPALGAFSPVSGWSNAGEAVTFSTSITDADGWQNVQYVTFIINEGIVAANAYCVYYNQNENKLYLRDDADTMWMGGFAPGSANTIENSYAKLDCAGTTVTGSGTTLTVNWKVTFKAAYAGEKNSFMVAVDDAGASSGWSWMGTWQISVGNAPPQIDSVSPTSGSSNPGESVTFTTTVSDLNGWQNVQYVIYIINEGIVAANGYCAYYNQNENKLYLRDDADTMWMGGFAPGSANVIENSYARLECAGTTVSGSGAALTINWKIAFKAAYAGEKNSFIIAADDAGVSSGWLWMGTWQVLAGNAPPQIDSVSPTSGSSNPGEAVFFTTAVSDPDGWQNIQYAIYIINEGIVAANAYCAYYNQNENKLYLRDDADTMWMGGFAPGSANTIENSYAKLDCAGTTVTGSGTTLTVNWKVAFKAAYAGEKNSFIIAADDAGSSSGWLWMGTWQVLSGNTAPQVDSVSPSAGSSYPNQRVVFTTTVSDLGGYQDVGSVQFFVNEGLFSRNGFAGYYVRGANKFYILNDDGTSWIGGYAPGAANVIENSYVKLECAQSAVSGSGNLLTVTWAVTFKAACVGQKSLLVAATDAAGAFSGWYGLGTWTILDGGPKERIYVYLSGRRIAMEENGQKYFFHNDHLGSTSVMTDGSGQEAKFIEYKPFGETKTETGALAVKKKFTGKELDDSTGLYDYAARQYDAKLGRFISPDTELSDMKNPQSLNRYSYVYNNPLKYTDPTGHVPMLFMLYSYLSALVASPDLQLDMQQIAMDAAAHDYAGAVMSAVGAAVPGLNAANVKAAVKGSGKVADTIGAGVRILNKVGKRGDVISKATRESGKTITVIGSLKDTGKFMGKPQFNVLEETLQGQPWSRQKQLSWLEQSLQRNDEIWMVTNPIKHDELSKAKGFKSEFTRSEIPYLERRTGQAIRKKFRRSGKLSGG